MANEKEQVLAQLERQVLADEVADALIVAIKNGDTNPQVSALVRQLLVGDPFAASGGNGGNYSQSKGNYDQCGGGVHSQGDGGDYKQSPKCTKEELLNVRDILKSGFSP